MHSSDRVTTARLATAEYYADPGTVERYIDFVERKGNIGTLVDYGVRNGVNYKGASVVDAGCGPGLHLACFEKVGAQNIRAVDLSPAMVEAARGRAEQLGIPCTVDIANITTPSSIPMPDETATIVSSDAVLLHLSPDEFRKAQKEFYRVLVTGGWQVARLLLESDTKREPGEMGRADIHKSGRLFWLYNPDEVQSMLEESGFVVDNIEPDSDLGGSWGRYVAHKSECSIEP